MTPKEKCDELINRFLPLVRSVKFGKRYEDRNYSAKEASLLCVDEILKELGSIDIHEYTKSESCTGRFLYWQQVKECINNL